MVTRRGLSSKQKSWKSKALFQRYRSICWLNSGNFDNPSILCKGVSIQIIKIEYLPLLNWYSNTLSPQLVSSFVKDYLINKSCKVYKLWSLHPLVSIYEYLWEQEMSNSLHNGTSKWPVPLSNVWTYAIVNSHTSLGSTWFVEWRGCDRWILLDPPLLWTSRR